MKKLMNLLIFYVLVSVIISLAFIFNIDKYKASLISKAVSIGNYSCTYEDLDNDGNSEKIEYLKEYSQLTGILVYKNGKTIDQWNFPGKWAATISPFIVDFDNDGVKEIFVFTLKNDSIFIFGLDAINRNVKIENKAVCKTYLDRDGEYDFMIYPCSAFDVNRDGYKELFFSIGTAFSLQPRNMFAYYPAKDSVMVSPESCSLVVFPEMFDFDKDSIPEFIASVTHAVGNCEFDRKYTDQFCWLMVFTPELKFKFPPIRIDAHPAVTRFMPFNTGNKNYIMAWHYYEGTQNFQSFMALFDCNGNLIRKKIINKYENYYFCPIFSKNDDKQIYILQKNGVVFMIDSLLQQHETAKFESNSKTYRVQKLDIDCDGEKEFIVPGKNVGEIIIYRNDFSNPVTLFLSENATAEQMSVIKEIGALPKIFVDSNSNLYTFSYKTTLWYNYRYFIFIPILLLILFFHFSIRLIKKYRKLKMDNIQQQIAELQFKSIKNRIDPHFTLNLLNSMNSLMYNDDKEKALMVFNKYTTLLRNTIISSDNITIPLIDEISFVKNYLDLEKFRFNDNFDYQIDIDNEVDMEMMVPKMQIQLFVENALKHGIRHLQKKGEIIISAKLENDKCVIKITDNGVGREKAKEYSSFSTKKGIEIIDEMLLLYTKLKKVKIHYHITDLYNSDNKPKGTEIAITIPINQINN